MDTYDYWFYLEPYTFVFHAKETYVIYNTVNAAYIDCSGYSGRVQAVLSELFSSGKTYCTGLTQDDLADPSMADFIEKVRNTFSGDIVENKHGIAPYVCKPVLHIYHHPDDPRTREYNLLGINSLLYLHEISFYLENQVENPDPAYASCFRQFPYPAKTGKQLLDIRKYQEIIEQLAICQLDKISVIPGERIDNRLLLSILELLHTYQLKTEIVLPYKNYRTEDILPLLVSTKATIRMMVHLPVDRPELERQMELFPGYNITWVLLVTTEEDLGFMENAGEANNRITCLPWYNGRNRSFFSTCVYTDLEDILEQPVGKQKIFRRQVLNENFFGKLTVLPTGEVYANPNFPCIGNLIDQKLTEIVYDEINNPSTPWFLTRKDIPCCNCVNKFLCPSVSNYEVVMNIYNMCYQNHTDDTDLSI